MTQIIKSNTGVMNSLISLGTYDGQTCCVDNFISSYDIKGDFKEGYIDYLPEEYWEAFDSKKYKDELQRLANEFIQENIAPEVIGLDIGIKGIKGVDIWSPKEYNFATDELILEIEVEDDFQETVIELIKNLDKKELKSYKEYLKRHCTSYDGFSSWVSNEIPVIIDEIQRDINATELDCFIDWYIEYHCDEDWSELWMYCLSENIYPSKFLPEDFEPISRHLVNSFPLDTVQTLCAELREVGDTLSEVVGKIIQYALGDTDSDHPLYFKDSEVEEYLKKEIREILTKSPMPLLDWNLTPKKFIEK